jgi:hypothetical protein
VAWAKEKVPSTRRTAAATPDVLAAVAHRLCSCACVLISSVTRPYSGPRVPERRPWRSRTCSLRSPIGSTHAVLAPPAHGAPGALRGSRAHRSAGLPRRRRGQHPARRPVTAPTARALAPALARRRPHELRHHPRAIPHPRRRAHQRRQHHRRKRHDQEDGKRCVIQHQHSITSTLRERMFSIDQ